jgi:diacylglycerol kinase (ATP)
VTSPYGPILLIVSARSRRASRRALPEVRRHLVERGLEHEVAPTRAPGDATRVARAALGEGIRFVVAVGSDATVHEVVNGMIVDDRAVRDDAVLGIVAAGRGCDFIRTFGIPPAPSHAAAHLDGPESFPIDIGKVAYVRAGAPAVSYFANVAQAGLGARTARRAGRLPESLGPTAYPLAFWTTALGHRASQVAVDLVDRRYEGPLSNLVVANGQFVGGGIKVAPRAAPTDGLLDIQIQHPSAREALALFPRAYRGEHVPHPEIKEAKRARVGIDGEPALPLEADGEVLGETPATFEVLPDALRLKV